MALHLDYSNMMISPGGIAGNDLTATASDFGAALGPIALRTALRPSGWNMLDDEARDGYPRLHVLDNVDPETIAALLDRLPLARTLFIVTSKSGGTAETMAQFLIVHDRLLAEGLDVAR